MKNIFIIALLLILGTTLQAQPINKSTTASLIEAADLAYEARDYYNAYDKYAEAYEEENDVELAYKMAMSSYLLRDYPRAAKGFNRVIKKDKKLQEYTSKIRYQYARSLKMSEQYEESIEQFQLFLAEATDPKLKELAQNEITGAEMAMVMLETLGLTVKHAGRAVNFSQSEYSPILDSDGETMYFSSFKSNEVISLDGKEGDYYVKIYESKKKNGKEWGKPVALDLKINREDYHTCNPALSPDGQRMYFNRSQLEGNYLTESKIHWSTRGEDGWGAANELVGVNGNYIAKQPAVGDLFGKEVLYFVSDMDGGYGGMDIYYSTYKGDGVYGDPINLGPKINTIGDEETPFYLDGVLYFSSDGHPGIGGFDIFNASWDGTGWSLPANMGEGFNSPVDDLYFKLDQEGYNGFLVSNRSGTKKLSGKTCCNDIYTVAIKKVEASLQASTLYNKKPLGGINYQLVEMTDNKMGATSKKSSGDSHISLFELELDKAYMLIGQKEGYFPDTLEFNTVGLSDSKQYEKVLNLTKIPVVEPPVTTTPTGDGDNGEPEFETYTTNQPIELKNIFYDYNDDKILADAEPDLQIILDLMNQYPEMKIELLSHTDARGKDAYNQELSQRRASSAKRWLVKRGITVTRIRAIGKGESEIRNQCTNGVKCSDDDHRYNRRTEFRITEGPTTIQIATKRLKRRN